jgi:curved DNA-binding protein CbpA
VYPGWIKLPPLADNPDLPVPSATGSFAKTPLSHLLVYAHDRELTGTFEFSGPAGQGATVLFIEGQPTKARAADAQIYLGRVLFELGILSDEQLGILLPRLLGSTELHGQVLISEGVITEEQLELALRAQLVRQMKWLVRLPSETTYKYYDCFDGLASYGGDGHVGIDPFPVVWACVRDEPPWEHVHLGLTSVGTAGLQLTETAETLRFSFDKAERATVELLRQKPWRIHELTASGMMTPRLVQLLVYCLLITKQVQLVQESKIPDASASEEEIPEAPPSSPFSGRLVDVKPAAPRTVARVQLAQRAQTRANVAIEEDSGTGRLEPEGEDGRTSYVATQPRTFKKRPVTGADGTSQSSSTEAAPPARATLPSTPPLSPRPDSGPPARATLPSAPPLSPRPEAAAPARPHARAASTDASHIPTPSVGIPVTVSEDDDARIDAIARRSPVAEVHTRPTVPKLAAVGAQEIAAHIAATEAKARASRAPEAKPPSSGARPTSASPPAGRAPSSGTAETKSGPISVKEDDDAEDVPASSPPPSLEPTPMTPELLVRKKEIEDKAATIDKEDHFTLLGVTRDTPTAEIQKAFFGLAKKWHPDRVPAPLAEVKNLCAKVFGRMSEAHQTLMDPAKRAKYESSRKAGSDDSPEAQAQVMAILGAATDFQKAEICLRRNDMKQAEEFCRKAIAVEPKQADYIAMLVWLESQKPQKQDPSSTQAQVAELTRAIGISQACERAFFYRAMLLKRLGQDGQAVKDFKRAMELNPRNVDATREVRLYNMRGGDKAKPGSSVPAGKKEEGGGLFGRLFKK